MKIQKKIGGGVGVLGRGGRYKKVLYNIKKIKKMWGEGRGRGNN